jgi:hypothetical protein
MKAPNVSHLALLCAATLLATVPAPADAQDCRSCDPRAPGARREALSIGANALFGGLAAGIQRRAQGGSFRAAFARGLVGGGATYAGKRIAVERFSAAGLLGRELSAVGSSVSRNAADGRGILSRVMVPVGPLHVYVGAWDGGGSRVRVRVDVAATAAAVYAATQPGARLDAGESLSSGAVMFRRTGTAAEVGFEGAHAAGTMTVRHPTGSTTDPEQIWRITAHERVHVLQYDQAFLLAALPAERWALRRSRATRNIGRWIDLGANAPAEAALGLALPYRWRPWEREAYYLSRTVPESGRGL